MNNQTIVIVGFMGSGKTTVARKLADTLNCKAVDLDEAIEEQEQRSVGEIIEREGEEKFREIETRVLRRVMNQQSAIIAALGGGAWTVEENRRLIIRQGAFTVWLDTPFELCWKRIEEEAQRRPLASTREAALSLYESRLPVYNLAVARIRMDETKTPREAANQIVAALSGWKRDIQAK